MKKLILICLALSAFSWDGYDWEKGGFVEIGKGNLVRRGRDIEIYDYKDGKYKDVEVQGIRKKYNGKVEVEVYDYEDNIHRVLEMDSYQDKKTKMNNFSSDKFLNEPMGEQYGDGLNNPYNDLLFR